MAIYPKGAGDRVVDPGALEAIVTAIFAGCGMSDADAALLAGSLVASDRRGILSHGVMRVPDYVKKMTKDGVDPRGVPTVVSDRGAAIVIDGHNSMGQIGGTMAMRRAIERAGEIGVAFAAVRGSNHCGAMDWYTLMAAEADMIGIAGTNAIPTMAPWGGTDRIVGINPLSIAMPAASGKPFVLDFAFGATAHGKIRIYHQKGSPIPEGWAFDAEGNPTTDAGAALNGIIQPIGQHKGVGLGMAVGMLSSLLSGAGYGTESGNMEDGAVVGVDGHFFMAINVAFFEDVARFKTRTDGVIAQVHTSGRRDGVERLYVPGEIESDLEAASRDGIVLPGTAIDDIVAAGKALGVDVTALAGQ
ncbi:Ldh family oxidoreductase [Bauldia litoralis]|uniref:Malate/lactate/ureidoglycolate dehydrogenase, LDH2 family n=1 Tax=Bauldia litoralis TaxID=665467 RepID=A0A1G6EB50_9HYPH|nr:Ldh family oxidoreductase [Bauldia litoralis]SDB54626.1 Malate/lactate/ureidoglycolate dehydrogenase, LDH2 family [Bauldia litoralis]